MNVKHEILLVQALFLVMRDKLAEIAAKARTSPTPREEQDLQHVCHSLREELDYLNTASNEEPLDRKTRLDDLIVKKMIKISEQENKSQGAANNGKVRS